MASQPFHHVTGASQHVTGAGARTAGEPRRRHLWSLLRRRWPILLTVLTVGSVGSGWYGHARVPLYRAEAQILVEESPRGLFGRQAVIQVGSVSRTGMRTQAQLLAAPPVLERVVDRLGMASGTADTEGAQDGFGLADLLAQAGRLVDALWIGEGLARDDADLPPEEARAHARDEVIERLGDRLSIKREGWSRVLTISLAARNPRRAAEIVNAVVDAYAEYRVEDVTGPTVTARLWIDRLVEELRQELAVAESAVEEHRAAHGLPRRRPSRPGDEPARDRNGRLVETGFERSVVGGVVETDLDDPSAMTGSPTAPAADQFVGSARDISLRAERRRNSLQGQSQLEREARALVDLLIRVRAERSDLDARLRLLLEQQRAGHMDASTEVMRAPQMARLWDEQRSLQRAALELQASLGPKHPQVIASRAEQQRVEQAIRQEQMRLVARMEGDLASLTARERSVDAELADLLGRTRTAARATLQLQKLERQADAEREHYQKMLRRQSELREQAEYLPSPHIQVLKRATPPVLPGSRGPGTILLAGLVASSALGVGLAWITEQADRRLRTAREVEQLTGLPCLAVLPELRERGIAPHEHLRAQPMSAHAEALRGLQLGLRQSDVDHPPRIVLLTSAAPDEGKTTTAIGLAATLAENGARVVLIDLDLRNPSVGEALGVDRQGRLGDYLAGQRAVGEVALPVAGLGFDLIIGDGTARAPGNVLASARLRDLLVELRAHWDHVVIDGPPVLGMTDAAQLAVLADRTLLVVRWRSTRREPVAAALAQLQGQGARLAGTVLTRADLRAAGRSHDGPRA